MGRGPARLSIAAVIFLVVFGVHVRSPVMTSYDSRWSIYTAMSLIREGNADLDEYADLLRKALEVGIERVGGRRYAYYPIGPSLLAVPFVLVLDRGWRWWGGEDLDRRLVVDPTLHERLERFIASAVVAATAVLVFLLARAVLGRAPPALLVAGIFAFGTSAWSTASRALWQHGPSMLLLTLALYLLHAGRVRPELVRHAGVPLALSYVVRPTNGLSAALLTLFVVRRHRAQAIPYLLGVGLVAAPFVAFSVAVYGAVVPPYYWPGRIGAEEHFLEALAGNLVSPARGLLVFSPVLLFSLPGLVATATRRDDGGLGRVVPAIVGLHWMVISSFPHWWGGHSYGPRLFSDMTPYLVYLLIPAVASYRQRRGGRRLLVGLAFAVTTAASVFVHYRGAVSQHADQWNARPVDIDTAPTRVWDWRDPQFLRGVRL